jgi:hypothetical protein
MKLSGRVSLSIVFGMCLFFAPAYSAQAPFYQGKNITFLINFAAGGRRISKDESLRVIWPSTFQVIRQSSFRTCLVPAASRDSIFSAKRRRKTL